MNEDKKKFEPRDVTFKALFNIGDKFRFTNTSDRRSGVYVIVGVYYRIFSYDFSDFKKVCSKLMYKLVLKEGYSDYAFPITHLIEEERLAKSVLIEKGYKYKIEKI